MDKFKKTDPTVLALFEKLTASIACDHKKMFGFPALFINGNMFAGTFGNNIFLRIRKEKHLEWEKLQDEIRGFEPQKGRIMKEYLEIPGKTEYEEIIKSMLKDSLEYAGSLKPKKPKV